MRSQLLAQARGCARLGSPMYAKLLTRAADDPGETVAEVLREAVPGEGAEAGFVLGMLGTVHRLVLEGRTPELAAHYPSAGGTKDPLDAWPAFRDVLVEHAAEVRAGLADPPQTNEVGRAAPLVGGLLAVAKITGLPVRLLEIGASAGLNLRADRPAPARGRRLWARVAGRPSGLVARPPPGGCAARHRRAAGM